MKQKKILFLSPYPFDKAPSQRLKYEQYFGIFEDAGYCVTSKSFITESFWKILYKKKHLPQKLLFTLVGYFTRYLVLLNIRQYDIVYIHLWGVPFGFPIFESIVVWLSKAVVYDIDDMIFLGDTNDANKIAKRFKGKRKIIFLMKNADHVITCTPHLDKFVRKYNSKTTDISSTIDTENRYLPRDVESNSTQLIIGWSGSYTTSKYLYLLKDVLLRLTRKFRFKLRVMGDKTFNIDGVTVEAVDWEEKNEISFLKSFDIGLYPLPDEPWVYGKSGLKAIQYMGLGIPTVATAIGANFRIITNAENGFLVPPNDYQMWESRISQLLSDPFLRKKLGVAGRKTIEEKYSLVANKQRYLNVFASLTK